MPACCRVTDRTSRCRTRRDANDRRFPHRGARTATRHTHRQTGFATPRPEPARSVSTLSASRFSFRRCSRVTKATQASRLSALSAVRACFIPETPLSFHLQGFSPPGDRDPSRGLILPCRWTIALRRPPPASKGCSLRAGRRTPAKTEARRCAFVAFYPLRLSLPPPWSWLPNSSPRALTLCPERLPAS